MSSGASEGLASALANPEPVAAPLRIPGEASGAPVGVPEGGDSRLGVRGCWVSGIWTATPTASSPSAPIGSRETNSLPK